MLCIVCVFFFKRFWGVSFLVNFSMLCFFGVFILSHFLAFPVQMVQLQMKFDSLSRMNASQAADSMAERDQMHLRSLQQRLEQLVAVHRQLLRKFASLELETVELKKKTQLKDDRIKQLEGSSRGLISNIRQQAERHVAELTHLREQIQVYL
jgi:predicted  nucleic acid-binding Zn-ribbon protein